MMLISANYICPVRGLAGLEPFEPGRLGAAARIAKGIGLERLLLPVLEEALCRSARSRIAYLDGLVRALDELDGAGLTARLIAPARRIMGTDFVPPHLVRGFQDPAAPPVFVDGRIRNLWPFDWWADPSLVQKRVRTFREVVAALQGHPALGGWLIMDRDLEWARPDFHVADLVLRSLLAEIRERDESESVFMGMGWSELTRPGMAEALAAQVDGLRLAGIDERPRFMTSPATPCDEIMTAAFLGSTAQWLFERPIEMEFGWGLLHGSPHSEDPIDAFEQLEKMGLWGVVFPSLIDPEPRLWDTPPWILRREVKEAGLVDRGLEPKEEVETWLKVLRSGASREPSYDFIDVSQEEFKEDPRMHLARLWDHFREAY